MIQDCKKSGPRPEDFNVSKVVLDRRKSGPRPEEKWSQTRGKVVPERRIYFLKIQSWRGFEPVSKISNTLLLFLIIIKRKEHPFAIARLLFSGVVLPIKKEGRDRA